MSDIEILARRYFKVELPVLSSVLKSAFRQAAKKFHTDTGGDKEEFIRMKSVYDSIQQAGLAVESDSNLPAGSWKTLRTVDGTPLTELGLGLGPTVNGRECDRCDAKGYTSYVDRQRVTCQSCGGFGNSRRHWFYHRCDICRGRGTVERGPAITRYHKCGACEGKGEIKIYNPVILKGAMSQAQRKRQK